MRKCKTFWMLVVALAVCVTPAVGQVGVVTDVAKFRFKQTVRVKTNGDADITGELVLPLRTYTAVKEGYSNTALLLRQFRIAGEAAELVNARAGYNDSRHAVDVSCAWLGAFVNRGRDWFAPVIDAESTELVDTDPEAITLLAVYLREDTGVLLVGTTRIEFPPGTKNIRFEPRRGGVFCELPPPEVDESGTVDVDMELRQRPEIMSCLYKLYGMPQFSQMWVAKAIFRNQGTAPVRDFRVRFRLSQYSSWSQWKRSGIVYPGQTVVEPFFPILEHSIGKLQSETPAMVVAEWSYQTPDGRRVEESDSRRLTILGLNEVLFSTLPRDECTNWYEAFNNSELIGAAFVTDTDPIIQRFAGWAADVAGGAAASDSDQGAFDFMQGVWELICYNGIRYTTPPGLDSARGMRQNVKFGRDVLRNKSGTCIDLAILFASTCQAVGLDPCLMMVQGHCFPVIGLPNGGVLPVEATMVNDKAPFEEAVQAGRATFFESLESGLVYFVNVKKLRSEGVPTPELPDLPPRTLDDWGIKPIPRSGSRNPGHTPGQDPGRHEGGGQRPQPPQPAPAEAMQRVMDPSGTWALEVPAGWEVQQQQDGSIKATHPEGTASMACAVAQRQVDDVEEMAETLVPVWEQSIPNWQMVSSYEIEVSGYDGLLLRATGEPQGQQLMADYALVVTKNYQFLLILECPRAGMRQWGPIFQDIVASWQVAE